MITIGEKVLVITRRAFEGDLRRHFVGEVLDTTSATVRVQGYSFVFDESTKDFIRHDELRIQIFSLIDSGLVIYILPQDICLEDIKYTWDKNNRRIITDQKEFMLNISEFTIYR